MTMRAPVGAPAKEDPPPRQCLARALAVIGLVAITVWWVTWTASRSILSEARSDAIGRALVHDDVVKDEVASQVREGMYLSGATSLGFTDADIAAAADAVAVDPEVEGLIAERVADAHRAALRPPDPYGYLTAPDDQPFVESSIRALEAQRDDISIPDLQWLFSTSVDGSFPDLTTATDQATTWRTPALLMAIACLVGSAIVQPDRRPRRWLARWCSIAGALTLVGPLAMAGTAAIAGGDIASALRAISSSMQGGSIRLGAILLVAIGVLLSLGSRAKAGADETAPTASGTALPALPSTTGPTSTAPVLAQTRTSAATTPGSRPVWRVSLAGSAETPTPDRSRTPTPTPEVAPVVSRNGNGTPTTGTPTNGTPSNGRRDGPAGDTTPPKVHRSPTTDPLPRTGHADELTTPSAIRDALVGAAEIDSTTAGGTTPPTGGPRPATTRNGRTDGATGGVTAQGNAVRASR